MIRNKGLHVFTFKNYCVTVMDNETSLRLFWTEAGALRWRDKIGNHAHAFHWKDSNWVEIGRKVQRSDMEGTET